MSSNHAHAPAHQRAWAWFLHGDIRFARAWPAIFLGAIALFMLVPGGQAELGFDYGQFASNEAIASTDIDSFAGSSVACAAKTNNVTIYAGPAAGESSRRTFNDSFLSGTGCGIAQTASNSWVVTYRRSGDPAHGTLVTTNGGATYTWNNHTETTNCESLGGCGFAHINNYDADTWLESRARSGEVVTWYTNDAGATYSKGTGTLSVALRTPPFLYNETTAYYTDNVGGGSPKQRVYRSTDGGLNWTLAGFFSNTSALARITVDPSTETLWGCGQTDETIRRSINQGSSWVAQYTITFQTDVCEPLMLDGFPAFIVRQTGVTDELHVVTYDGVTWSEKEFYPGNAARDVTEIVVTSDDDSYAAIFWQETSTGPDPWFAAFSVDGIEAGVTASGYHFLKDLRLNDVANDGADIFVRRNDLDTIGSPNPNALERLHRFSAGDLTHEKQVDPCDGGAGRNGVFGRGGLAVSTDGFVIAACRGTFTGDFNSVLFTSELSEVGAHDFDTNPGKTDLNDGTDPSHWVSFAAGTANNLTVGIPDPDGASDELVSVDAVNLLTRWRKSLDGLRASDRDRTGTGISAVTGSFGTRLYGQTGALVTNQGGISGQAIAIHGTDVWVATDETVTLYNTTGSPWTTTASNTDPTSLSYGGLRASRDGNVLVAWSTSRFWVMNATSMDTIGTGFVTDMIAADIRADNDALYAANYTSIFKYDITGLENITFDPGGVGDDGGTGSTEDGDVPDPTSPGAAGPLFDTSGLIEAGYSEGAAGWLWALLWIFSLGITGFVTMGREVSAGAMGAAVGFGISITAGLIPLYWAFLVFMILGVTLFAKFRGGV